MRTRRENCLLSSESPSVRAAEQIIRRLKSGRRERNFWMQRREAKNRPKRPLMPAETERPERYRRISPQKRPIWSLDNCLDSRQFGAPQAAADMTGTVLTWSPVRRALGLVLTAGERE